MLRAGHSIVTSRGRLDFSVSDAELSRMDTDSKGRNRETIRFLVYAYLSLLADSPLNSTAVSDKPPSVFRDFFRSMTSRPIREMVVEYADLAQRIVSTTVLEPDGPTTGTFLPEMRSLPIFREYHTWYKTADPRLLQYVYTFLNFGKKMQYVDEAFEPDAFRAWVEIEEELSSKTFEAHVDVLRRILTCMVPFKEAVFEPRFGPGAVAEKGVRGMIEKVHHLSYHPRLAKVFSSPVETLGRKKELGYDLGMIFNVQADAFASRARSGEVSTLRLVPKSVKVARTICMEPNLFMFAQQGVAHRLLRDMRLAPITREVIDIQDQGRNRELARLGSLYGTLDTIDLSAASDRVHVDLVRKIFPARVLFFLLATRTSKVRVPDGRVINVSKFAPMGSALCFPVQSLVFAACCIYAAMLYWLGEAPGGEIKDDEPLTLDVEGFFRKFSKDPSRQDYNSFSPLCVYGDDIIIDSKLTPYLTNLLSELGLKVNLDKSFQGSQAFRESCGGFYWGGHDVTPLLLKAKGFSTPLSAEAVASLAALANTAGDLGYRNLRRLSIRYLSFAPFEGTNARLPFTDKRDVFGIYSKDPRNTHLRLCRENPDWQCIEYWVASIGPSVFEKPRAEELPAVEFYLYNRWWSSRRGMVFDPEFSEPMSRTVTGGARIRGKWVPSGAF